jgi:hypothetical protein
MKHKLFSALCLAALLLATSAAAFDSGPFAGRGIVRAVRSIEGIVLLENDQGFELLNLDEDATVQDSQGASIALRDLPLGTHVEYTGRYWQGLNFARSLRVSPVSLVISAR